MNYLAHLLLSGDELDIQVGGLLGDFVKGPLVSAWPADIEFGIRLHRQIDSLTDRHPAFVAATQNLEPPWRRYRGILLDVYFDHLLARRWQEFHPEPLPIFCRRFYRHLAQYRSELPPRVQHFCDRAPEVSWLESYARADKVPVMLDNVGRRLRRPVTLGQAWPLLDGDRLHLNRRFDELMAELIEFAEQQRQQYLKG